MLAEAKAAEERLIEAAHNAELARAEFHRAVRRLHLTGASLRELAGAFRLSHQRVHQIVEAAGGARRWRRRREVCTDPACSFCGRAQRRAGKLVAGPGVWICEACVEVAAAALSHGGGAGAALGHLQPVPEQEKRQRCSFCGKQRPRVSALATTSTEAGGKFSATAAICAHCLSLCREIASERPT